ncbi:MAG: hypothetical protein J3Q66DRAFT_390971 [Benniella sp.]|nr:MAG: hypothetical protein J3Q66DRAFT_390971 [Benniella sp.]
MLDLPELLERVFQHLNRHDLIQCVQVNKQWHALTIPHLWRDLTCVNSYGERRKEAFRRIVLEDYLQEKGYREGPPQPSALSKYGHLIRLLPSPEDLESALQSQAFTRQCTAHYLLLHLLKRSSKAKVKSLRYRFKDLESNKMKSTLAFTLPRVRSLDIQASLQGTQSEFIKFKNVLDQCSTILENLNVDLAMLHADEAFNMDDEATENESICWTSLKELTLRHHPDIWDAGPVWSWMWKRCGQVEKLCVRKIDQSTPSFVQAMSVNMPKLKEIIIGVTYTDQAWNLRDAMEDDVVAALLSGSRHGWKAIKMKSTARPGQKSMDALAMHYSGLEEVYIHVNYCLPSYVVVQVLRSCPNLHTLIYSNLSNGSSVVDVKAFIDLDPNTGLLKPWLCEGSLKILEVKIAGIPRPDLKRKRVIREAYPGQGHEIQSQVYDRLGRLTNLDTLRLGDGEGTFRYDCLEMSMKSGLDKLSGLKSLDELSIERLATKIGTQEVQWMVENWPKLRYIFGLDGNGRNYKAVGWLRENRSMIVVLRWALAIVRDQRRLPQSIKHTSLTSSLLHLIVFPSPSQPMLDLPELLDKVLQHLNHRDLPQCAQVNKQWHALTIPHIWRDLTCVYSYNAGGKAFHRIVLEDYLQENGYQEEPPQRSALSKYGHLIRLLPNPVDLESAFRSQASTQQDDGPMTHDLLFHLFKRSSKVQVYSLSYKFLDPESDNMKSIMEFTLPRLRSLHTRASLQGTQSEFFKFKSVLDKCSTTQESLHIHIDILRAVEAIDIQDEATEDESICWTSLKNLTLRHHTDAWDAGPFWSCMWKRCGQVERLDVLEIDKSTPSLVQAMLAYMHNLQQIVFGDYIYFDYEANLENGMAFIDLDPDTGLLKPWLCERSLEVIEVKIAPIPGPDSENKSAVAEAYPGQGREIQNQVYDRIARLIHLDTLMLGYRFHASQYPGYRPEMSLEMSLESGLDKLSGLKSLKELSLEGLATKIGTQEVQWMLENWPKLRNVWGLDWCGMVEAVEQLRENPL